MMNMRPFQIIVISIFGILALGGLFLFATFKGFGGANKIGQVVIWGTLPAATMNEYLASLIQTHQELEKVTYVERDAGTFDSGLSDALASGTGPDLIITNQEHLLAERTKLTVIPNSKVTERTYRDVYVPITEIFLTSGGTYGIPFVIDPLVLYYNRASLASAAIPQVPRTWEAVLGVVPQLTQKSDTGLIERPAIALGTYDNIGNARAILSLLLIQSGSSVTTNSTYGLRSTIASSPSGDAPSSPGESAVSFYTQFADPAKTVHTWSRSIPDARQSFLSGDSAFYIGFASERSRIAAANPNLDFDMEVIPQPQTSVVKSDYAIAYAFAIPRGSTNPEGAFTVAQMLSSKEINGGAAMKLGMAPSLRALLTPPAGDIYAAVYYPAALAAKAWLSPSPAATDRIFAAMINDVVSGRRSVHDALIVADQSLTAALQ
jgi:ABC-type glycerol-3-phosphate transport system substrate-binding protein